MVEFANLLTETSERRAWSATRAATLRGGEFENERFDPELVIDIRDGLRTRRCPAPSLEEFSNEAKPA
jgi:hypothetical protein